VIEALWPSPSRGTASLTFTLAQASPVEVRVHDVAGRQIRVMDVGLLPSGRHQATWNGRRDNGVPASAGVYFVSLRVEGRIVGNRHLVMLR
jgi:flagellar hook assembly protein FlgD